MSFYNCNRGGNNGNGNSNGNGNGNGNTALSLFSLGNGNGNGNGNGGNVQALIDCIIDHCRANEQLTQTFVLQDVPFQPEACSDGPRLGATYTVQQCGGVSMEILNRTSEATTVMFSIPVVLMHCNGCALVPFLRARVTGVRSYCLQGSGASDFRLLDSEVLALTAVITGLNDDNDTAEITVTANINVHVAEIETRTVCLRTCEFPNVPACVNCRNVRNGN